MTVANAYRELRRRGLVSGAGRRGTQVSRRPPLGVPAEPVLPAGVRDLSMGNPDPELLPALDGALAAVDPAPRLYRPAAVLPELARLARAQFAADGIDAPHIAAAGGALDAVERVLGAHLRPGDAVAVEDPGYVRIFDLLRAAGYDLVPVEVDDSGMLPDALANALHRGVAAVVATPRAQNPRGAALDAGRTAELRDVLARRPEVLVVEDDHAGVVAGAPAFTLCDPARGPWAIARSVSKTLGPDLRLAVIAGDRETLARVEGRQMLGTGWVSSVLQQMVAWLWRDKPTRKLVETAGKRYTERRSALIAALAEHGVEAYGRSGLLVWVPVAEETTVATGLLERGWAVMGGSGWRLAGPPAMRITIATLLPDEAKVLAADMAEVMTQRVGTYSV